MHAQETPEPTPTVDPQDTYFHQEYTSGAKFTQGYWKKDKRDGHWVSWYPDGNKESEGNYDNGEEVGVHYLWYENGDVHTKADYAKGVFFLHREGAMVDETEEGQFDKDKNRIGKWTTHLKGWGSTESFYKAGFLDGSFNAWDEEGHLTTTGNYANGMKTGHWKIWSNVGNMPYFKNKKDFEPPLQLEGDYVLGEKSGLWILYCDSKNQKQEITYQNGIETGCIKYFSDGKMASKLGLDGDGFSKTSWDQNGNLESQCEIHGNSKVLTYWYPNGKKTSVQSFETDSLLLILQRIKNTPSTNTKISGNKNVYPEKIDPNGTTASRGLDETNDDLEDLDSQAGKAEGPWSYWDEEGKLLWAKTFKDGDVVKWSISDEDSHESLDLDTDAILKIISDLNIQDPLEGHRQPGTDLNGINAYLKKFRGSLDEIVVMAYGHFLILDKNYQLKYQKDLSGHNSGNELIFKKAGAGNKLEFTYLSDFETGVNVESWSTLTWDDNRLVKIDENGEMNGFAFQRQKRKRKLSQLELAKNYYRRHQYAKAIRAYKVILKKEPNNSEVYGLMGYSYYRNHQLPQAISALQTSLKMNPNELMSYYNLSLAYWTDDQKSDSVKQLKLLFKFDPQYERRIKEDGQFDEILKSSEYKTMIESLNN